MLCYLRKFRYFWTASQKTGKKWSLEDDEEEELEEDDGKNKGEHIKLEPMEAINEETNVQEVDEEDEVDPLDAFMKVIY